MKLDTNFVTQLRAFIDTRHHIITRARWIECEQLALYVRLGHRNLNALDNPKRYSPTLEIANVCVRVPYQGIGLYNELLTICDEYLSVLSLYIENVADAEQHKIYIRRGYEFVPMHQELEPSASFFKLSSKEIS